MCQTLGIEYRIYRNTRSDWEVCRLFPENYLYIKIIYVIEGWYVLSRMYKYQVNTFNDKDIAVELSGVFTFTVSPQCGGNTRDLCYIGKTGSAMKT